MHQNTAPQAEKLIPISAVTAFFDLLYIEVQDTNNPKRYDMYGYPIGGSYNEEERLLAPIRIDLLEKIRLKFIQEFMS